MKFAASRKEREKIFKVLWQLKPQVYIVIFHYPTSSCELGLQYKPKRSYALFNPLTSMNAEQCNSAKVALLTRSMCLRVWKVALDTSYALLPQIPPRILFIIP